MLQESFGGGVRMNFEAPDSKTEDFAREFISEMRKKKDAIDQFIGQYLVNGYLGAWEDKITGEKKSVIGIFVNNEEKPIIVIWYKDLFSKKEIKKKAKEAADQIFEYLKEMDKKIKIKLKGIDL